MSDKLDSVSPSETHMAARLTRKFMEALGYAASLVPVSLWKRPVVSEEWPRGEELGSGGSGHEETRRTRAVAPSLYDAVKKSLGGSSRHEDVLMQAVETWPVSRVDLLRQVRRSLRARLARIAAVRSEIALTDVFGSLQPLGEGVYGAVYIGCIRRGSGSGVCERFFIDVPVLGRQEITIFLAVKTTKTPERVLSYMHGLRNPPVFLGITREGNWFGHANVMREVLLGRFLNHLVQAGVTPHFPMVYESFEVSPGPGTIAIAMELCHMDFDTFLTKVLPRVTNAALRLHMLRVSLMQLAHGIAAAQLRLDFRHNDLHSRNAMMTFITNTVYTYTVRGTDYAVPNLGMCWKLTDFGFGSSSYLFDASDTMHALKHSGAARKIQLKKSFPSHAVEVVDFLRLLRHARHAGHETRFPSQVEYCTQVEVAIHALAQKLPSAAGSVRAFSVDPADKESTEDTAALLEMSRSNGLMTDVFILLASPLVIDTKEAEALGGPRYDMDARLYTEGLSGMESNYYAVHSSGRLLKRR